MQLREQGLNEVYQRVKEQRITLGLKAFKRTPTTPIDDKYLPAIFMDEGIDEVTVSSERNPTGYPMRRVLEIIIELVVLKSETDIKQLYIDVRKAVFNGGVVVADNTIIKEIRTEGPNGYGLPNIVGMRLVLALSYTDDGN